ncbi:MAG: hypothetical protein RLZZ373_3942 [Pseudomonadota bacterium]|jgi:hypothetical protein
MNAIVIEHVPVTELPVAWRDRLTLAAGAWVTVRIETETQTDASSQTTDPAFGLWRDRDDIVDVEAHVRGLRASRFSVDGSRHQP